jgi:molybdopterin converting factor small subunit
MFARARDAAGRASDEFAPGSLGDVLGAACARYGELFAEVLSRSAVWVNGEQPDDVAGTTVVDGDEVAILPPVSGG